MDRYEERHRSGPPPDQRGGYDPMVPMGYDRPPPGGGGGMDRYERYERQDRYDPGGGGSGGDRYERYDRNDRYEREPPPPPPPRQDRYDRYDRYERADRYDRYERADRYDRYEERGNSGGGSMRGDYGRARSRSPEMRYDAHSYGRDRDRGRLYDRPPPPSHMPPPPMNGPPMGRSYGGGGPRGGGGGGGGGGRMADADEDRIRRETTSIFVGNLPHHFDEHALRAVFEQIGPVSNSAVPVDMRTGESRRFGFVSYMTREDAERAMDYFKRTAVEDRYLRLDW
ncbi:hypothetical protein THASP1DRAFT_24214 [Thamnocephalis sphaerospora]|uniref:RRM domain-containing protein n=1 Tax=Thamnocephalis sphaerospora TaxID=78915 RepID=A0A4P9XNX4_9FUNG|nr:hypothetical protein THASP1DRAFT_24214 [Thamnocephalis sphaerospora]|eukprot:RKP07678.1 hypothetical protein THASP1DRAFT_24214 [Thamnocephalis sphaerospora]